MFRIFQISLGEGNKYSRNVTILSSTIIVLAWVPGISIQNFKPFGFEACRAEPWIWIMLLIVLCFYTAHLTAGLFSYLHTTIGTQSTQWEAVTSRKGKSRAREWWNYINTAALNTCVPYLLFSVSSVIFALYFVHISTHPYTPIYRNIPEEITWPFVNHAHYYDCKKEA